MSVFPLVSVVIPTYNYAHFLDETITSVLAQTFTDYELIVVDNHSTDNTFEVVSKYLSDPRVTFYQNKKNLGLVGNWNRCLELANGKYIKLLCADDKWHPTILEKYVEVMEQHPGVSLVTCDKKAFGTKSHETITPLTHLQNGTFAILHMVLNNYCWIGEPSSVMFRKSDLDVGNFSDEYKQYIDYEMWIRLLTKGDCYIIPEILTYVRFHGATNSNELKKQRFILCFEEYKLVKDIQQHKYDIKFPVAEIDLAVEKRARFCIRHAMLKNIPYLHDAAKRIVFKKALVIAREERLLFAPIQELLVAMKRRFVKQLQNRMTHDAA
jgi:glycosyltransferase involved in cell wall biosynthesis